MVLDFEFSLFEDVLLQKGIKIILSLPPPYADTSRSIFVRVIAQGRLKYLVCSTYRPSHEPMEFLLESLATPARSSSALFQLTLVTCNQPVNL
jgi:hypothetical protein